MDNFDQAIAPYAIKKVDEVTGIATYHLYTRIKKRNYLVGDSSPQVARYSKAVLTPLGKFASIKDAAIAHNVPYHIARENVKNNLNGWKHDNKV